MMTDLKPCPFCGGTVQYNFDMVLEPIGVFCPKCHAVVRFTRVKPMGKRVAGAVMDEIADAWNRRDGIMDARDLDMLGMNLAEVGTEPTNIVKNCNDKSSGSDDYSYKSAEVGTECISRQAAIDAIDVLCQEHRYKIPGKRETYSQYNEAWQDALDRAEGAIFNLPSAQPEPCEDAVGRDAVVRFLDDWISALDANCHHQSMADLKIVKNDFKNLPSAQQMRWIPCSERVPEGWQWFYATCRSKADNRENWVIEGLSNPWKLWGDLPPMVKEGDAEIIAWMPKELPEPYKGD